MASPWIIRRIEVWRSARNSQPLRTCAGEATGVRTLPGFQVVKVPVKCGGGGRVHTAVPF